MEKRLFKTPGLAIVTGVAFLGAAYVCLWDAYDRRNRKAPWPFRNLLPW